MNLSSKYQQIVVRDVQNQNYKNHKKIVWTLFIFFGACVTLVYAFFFHFPMWIFSRLIIQFHVTYLGSRNVLLSDIVYVYEYVLLFVGFMALVILLGFLSFFFFDMQQRNEVIQKLLISSHNKK